MKMALKGIQVLELAGLAPGPFCGMILSDFGASVIAIKKVGPKLDLTFLEEGKSSVGIDLKKVEGQQFFRQMIKKTDVLIEPFRAGVMENLNLGPKILLADNPRLIYARLTGFGQFGPLSKSAGHDINFLALSGLQTFFGWRNKEPCPPTNFAADFAGGSLICALGIIMALYEREKSGLGQVLDASMVEGTAYAGSWFFRTQSFELLWGNRRGENLLDGGAFFYDIYETKDNKWLAVGAVEPQFYTVLLETLNLSEDSLSQLTDFETGHAVLSSKFKEKTQEEWIQIFEGKDACVTPVLSPAEAVKHSHNVARNSFKQYKNQIVPNPAPKLSRTPGISSCFKTLSPETNLQAFISSLGFSDKDLDQLILDGIIELETRKSKI